MKDIHNKKYIQILKDPVGFKTLLVFICLLTIFLLIQTYGKAYRDYGYDFTSYLLSSKAFYSGLNPYQTETRFPFIYPLFLCLLLQPLIILPYWLAVFLWFIGSFLAIFFSAFIFLRMLRPAIPKKSIYVVFASLYLLLFPIISNNYLNGQINFYIVLLCVLFLKLYLKGRKLYAGWALAAAVSIKLTPLIFFIFLVIRRDISSIFIITGQIIILSFILPFLFLGSKTIEFYDYYLQTFLLPKLSGEVVYKQSVSFALMSIPKHVGLYIPKLFSFIAAVLIVIGTILYLEVKNKRIIGNDFNQLSLFSLYMLSMLLISPMSETHHMIHIFPALLILGYSYLYLDNNIASYCILFLAVIFLFIYFGKIIPIGFLTVILTVYVGVSWLLMKSRRGLI